MTAKMNDGRSIKFDGCEDDAGEIRFHVFSDGRMQVEIFDQEYKREIISCGDRNDLLMFLAEIAIGRAQKAIGIVEKCDPPERLADNTF